MDSDITTIINDPAVRIIQEPDGSRSYSLTKTTTATVKVKNGQISDRMDAHKANIAAANRAIQAQQEIIDGETAEMARLQAGLDALATATLSTPASKVTP